MPWESKKQARWGHWAAKVGKFPASKLSEFDSATNFKKLPASKTPAYHQEKMRAHLDKASFHRKKWKSMTKGMK